MISKLFILLTSICTSFAIFAQFEDSIKLSSADIVLDGWHYDMGNISATRYCKGQLCNGKYIDTFSNGNMSSKTFVIDGKAHGVFEGYYENLLLMMRGAYERGKRIGFWEFYYESGQLEFEATYNIKYFYPRTAVHHYENGNIQLISAYTDEDVMIYQYEFFEDGTKNTSIELIDADELIY